MTPNLHAITHLLRRLARPDVPPACCPGTCPACGQDTLKASVFTCWAEERPGVSAYGMDLPGDDVLGLDLIHLPARCRGCRVALGGIHHDGCLLAGCTLHDYAQRIGCGCDR